MLIVMKKEDDVRKQLRNVSIRINRSQLEKQIELNKVQKLEDDVQNFKNYSSTAKFTAVYKEQNNFGPGDSPEKMELVTQKAN